MSKSSILRRRVVGCYILITTATRTIVFKLRDWNMRFINAQPIADFTTEAEAAEYVRVFA